MKKVLISLLAVAGVLAACDQLEKVQIPSADDVIAPVLNEVPESIEVTGEEDNGKLEAEFLFTPADFKQKVAGIYSLYGVYSGKTLPIVSLASSGEAKVSYTAFNKGVMTAFPEIIPGRAFDLEVKVGVTIGNTYDNIFSNSKTIRVTTYPLKERKTNYPEYDEVSTWGLTGDLSEHKLNWGNKKEGEDEAVPDLVMYTDGIWHLCEKVTVKAGEQFKFRENSKWDSNFGADGDVEPFALAVGEEYNAAAGGKNFTTEEDGVYDIFLDPANKKVKILRNAGDAGGEPMDIPAVVRAYFRTENGAEALESEMTGDNELTVKTVPAESKPFPVVVEFDIPKGAKIASVNEGTGESAFTKAEIVAGGVAVAFWADDNAGVTRTFEASVSFSAPKKSAKLIVKVIQAGKNDPEPEPEPVTYSHTFVLGDFGLPAEESAACYPAAALTDSFDDIEWTLDSVAEDGRFFMFVTEGWMAPSIQVGYGWSGAGDPSSITLSTSDIGGTITKIVARYVTFDEGENDGGKYYSVAATVGGVAFGDPVAHVNEAPSATFEGEASGEIVITWTQDPAFCTCFLKGIDVTYIPAE
ncbi:MAG: hypothetical protein IKR69_01775 [Bacteroidales bacterium]|nr:hypothetical protein [Bacteroidales bacterium]